MPPPTSEQARWFSEEVHAHDASLKRYLRRSFPTVRDVEDLVQESYLRVWRRQLIRPITEVSNSVTASVKGFLFQVARRLAVDTIRRDQASPVARVTDFSPSSVIDDRANTHEAACTQQEFELLLEAIDALPARCREVLVLRKIQGLSPAETARLLGLAEETVHVHTRRGLQRVQETLRRRGVIRASRS
jgi:RNA polymerase sigma factor (sigma-70 family)